MRNLTQMLTKIGSEKTCTAVLIYKNNKILLGLRNYTPDKWKEISVWTLPGGRCDQGETIEVTLKREVAEEIGITDLLITEFIAKIDGAKEGDILYVFKAETKQEPQLLEPQKFSEWKWTNVSEIPVNFINPKLLDLI